MVVSVELISCLVLFTTSLLSYHDLLSSSSVFFLKQIPTQHNQFLSFSRHLCCVIMRDIVSCFSENAVNVSSASCSSYSAGNACISPALTPSVQTAVSSVYRVVLSTKKQVLIRVCWCRNQTGQGLSIYFGDDPSSPSFKLNTNSRIFRKKKGTKQIESDNSKMELFWDLSAAKYETGPEPVDGFYVLVIVDSEIGLILGDLAEESVLKKIKVKSSMAKVNLISRQEHCSGNTIYATRAQFCETGVVHEIMIRCSGGESQGVKAAPVLSVSIDKKTVIRVKRLQWNFRGNQTIFVDGLLVDLLWDVHDWFFGPVSGYAVFMFRTRSGLDSRLWLEEKLVHKEEDQGQGILEQFSLLVCASK